jgi:thiosulfate reductase cytochrome b subunit
MAESLRAPLLTGSSRHARWVRLSHWLGAVGFLLLTFTGVVILMAHPRLYWGEVGNDLTPAILELPISRNYHHGGFDPGTPFFPDDPSRVSASRTYDIFNQNGWGRSLHFLAAWLLVLAGAIYLSAGVVTRHVWRHLVPGRAELAPQAVWRDVAEHLRLRIRKATGGPQYSLLQKSSYLGVVLVALPLTVVTGLAMSPTVAASAPFLPGIFGGLQSARTVHFFAFVALTVFLVVHVAMVVLSGFTRQMRGMTIGGSHDAE